ncbi:protein of unknown function [Noviherbaspirillum humi]|uniref:Transglutaminase-like domain-containing protein n=1 Tax=Noviherbaspirillum humi TaxID=1688639 RepID=A0A239DZG0_9BURK|nr:DUF3488 and transglutaminase-like domain-containing protein [Noviherbaspirillum humi]SNS37408.1 protein of unknown function [Noviherbaspirillum humi]
MKRLFATLKDSAGMAGRPLSDDKTNTLLLMLSCLLVLAPHASHQPGWIIGTCSFILLWRGWIVVRGNRLPPPWLVFPICLLAMAGVYLTYRTFLGRDAGVSMLVLLLTLKLLEMRARRDLFVVIFLCFFLLLTGFFYSQTLATALAVIAAVAAILTTQVSFQYAGLMPTLRERLRLGTSILLLAAPLTVVLFLLFPRIQGPLWGMPVDTPGGRTGMSDFMSPGNIANLALSEAVAFRVKFDGPPPPNAALYWRGPVLSAFDGRTWTPLPAASTRRAPSLQLQGKPVRYQLTLEPHGGHWLFALDMPDKPPLLVDSATRFGPEMEVQSLAPVTNRLRYDQSSYLRYSLQPHADPMSLEPWLELPQRVNPRTHALAQEIHGRWTSDAQRVNAVLRHFREQPFRYTLQPPTLGHHSVDEFLFDTRAGFCEHYSSAFVVLMRGMGIPARVVTGYQGGEINPADGYMTIRQSDAHAWAEVWLNGRGWVRVDPTAAVAPERVERNLSSILPRPVLGGLFMLEPGKGSMLERLRAMRQTLDAMSNAWNQWVLNYTPEKQKNFIESLGFADADWRTLTLLLLAAGSVALGIVVVPLLMTRPRLDPLEALYARFCRRLARQGFSRLPHEGPRAFAQRLAAESPYAPEKKAALARFLACYEAARYGPPSAVPGAASQLKSLLLECR